MKVVVTSSKRMRPPKRIVTLLTASIALDYTVEIAEREIGDEYQIWCFLAQNHGDVTWRRLREFYELTANSSLVHECGFKTAQERPAMTTPPRKGFVTRD